MACQPRQRFRRHVTYQESHKEESGWYGGGTRAQESHAPGFSKELLGFVKCNEMVRLQFDLFHRLLIPLLQFFIQRDVLIDGQGLAA